MRTAREDASDENFRIALRLIRWSCVVLFLARAWQHLFLGTPYRELLWDEALLKPLVEGVFSITWAEYVTSDRVDHFISGVIQGIGVFYFLCAAACLRVTRSAKLEKYIIAVGAFGLLLLALIHFKESRLQVAMFFEFTSQLSAPLVLLWMLGFNEDESTRKLDLALRAVISLTFVSHGLYAIGFYSVPGHFMDMTMAILGVENAGARIFLAMAGAFDCLVGIALCSGVLVRKAYFYAALWGMATALARLMAHVSSASLASDLNQWLPETLVRTPHALIPLAAWLILREVREQAWAFPDRLVRDLYREQDS